MKNIHIRPLKSNTNWKYNIVQTSLRLFVLLILTIGIYRSMILHHVFGLSAISLSYNLQLAKAFSGVSVNSNTLDETLRLKALLLYLLIHKQLFLFSATIICEFIKICLFYLLETKEAGPHGNSWLFS